MSPSLCRYDTLERDAAIIVQGPASVWFGRLEVAYRRALDAFPCRPAVLSSPSIASIGYSSRTAAIGQLIMHGGQAGNFLLLTVQQSAQAWVAYRPRLRMAMARMLMLRMLSN